MATRTSGLRRTPPTRRSPSLVGLRAWRSCAEPVTRPDSRVGRGPARARLMRRPPTALTIFNSGGYGTGHRSGRCALVPSLALGRVVCAARLTRSAGPSRSSPEAPTAGEDRLPYLVAGEQAPKAGHGNDRSRGQAPLGQRHLLARQFCFTTKATSSPYWRGSTAAWRPLR
jgi:hypothetical protein